MIFLVFVQPLTPATNRYHAAIIKEKRDYNSKLISSILTNPHKLWHAVTSLLHRRFIPVLPSSVCLKSLSQSFATFFSDKIHKLHTSILSQRNHGSPHVDPSSKPIDFSSIYFATVEVSKLLSLSPVTICDLDPTHASLVKQYAFVLVPTITKIINLALSCGVFPAQFKNCSVHSLPKKSNLEKESLANYRPVSQLTFLSKLTETLVKHRLMNRLSEYNLLNSFQSAYIM
jgi:hypothetical protein